MAPRLAVLLALALPASALGNLAASRPNPAVGSVPVSPGTPVRVTSETLSFTCLEQSGEPVCAFVATYSLLNPAAQAETVVAAFVGHRSDGIQATSAGAPVSRSLTDAEIGALQAVLQAMPKQTIEQPVLEREGMTLTLAAGAIGELTVTGRLHPGRFFVPTYAIEPPKSRHPMLGSEVPRSTTFNLDYLVSPIRSWGGGEPVPIRMTLSHPESWRVAVWSGTPGRQLPLQFREHADSITASFSSADIDTLGIALELPPPKVFNGGVLAGIGGNLDDSGGVRLRLGYEIASPAWLFWSAAAETSFKGSVVLVPAIEATTPNVMIVFPSFGAGLGIPVRLGDEVKVGGRFQLSMQWPVLGMLVAFDAYPGPGFSAPDRWQVSMMAQFGL